MNANLRLMVVILIPLQSFKFQIVWSIATVETLLSVFEGGQPFFSIDLIGINDKIGMGFSFQSLDNSRKAKFGLGEFALSVRKNQRLI